MSIGTGQKHDLGLPWMIGLIATGIIVAIAAIVMAVSISSVHRGDSQGSDGQPAAQSSPDPTSTIQPLVHFKPSDYPCSKTLYEARNRISAGSDLATIDNPPVDTTAYCLNVKQAVDRLPTIQEKVNHLVVEYCKYVSSALADNESPANATDPDPHQDSLDDIYGSLYGTLSVKYDKSEDLYDIAWNQRPTNGLPAYLVGGQPSLEPLADKYCPVSTPTQVPQTGTGQG